MFINAGKEKEQFNTHDYVKRKKKKQTCKISNNMVSHKVLLGCHIYFSYFGWCQPCTNILIPSSLFSHNHSQTYLDLLVGFTPSMNYNISLSSPASNYVPYYQTFLHS